MDYQNHIIENRFNRDRKALFHYMNSDITKQSDCRKFWIL